MRGWCGFLVLVWSLVGISSAWAAGEGLSLTGGIPQWPNPDMVSVRTLGMGGAGVALADATDGIYINPAGLGRRLRTYIFEGSFAFHPAADSRIFNVGLADCKSNPLVSAGLAYTYFTNPREDDGDLHNITGHVARLGVAMGWQKKLYLGLMLKYLYLTRPFLADASTVTIDAGLIWQAHPLVSLSVVGYNLIYNPSNELPISMAVGIAVGNQTPFRAAVDWVIDFQSKGSVGHELRVGAEYTIMRIVSIRLGYHLDQVRDRRPLVPWLPEEGRELSHSLSAGIGFHYRQFGANIAFRQQLAANELINNRYLGFSIQIWL